MGDAEIIPLGTRGRPGRGSGKAKPSASSRSLAGPAKRPARPEPAPSAAPEPPIEEPVAETAAPVSGDASGDIAAKDGSLTAARSEEHSGPRTLEGFAQDLLVAATAAAREVFGDDADRRLAEMLAFLRRRVTGDYHVDEYGLDTEVTEKFILAMIRPLATRWFRVEVRGAENIPEHGGALLVANHSGTIPVDGLMTMFAVHETTGRYLRPLGADLVFRLPFVGELARKAGATLACNEDAVRMLCNGELAGVWPEGFKGIGKPYSDRYKLQRFGRGGFVSAAIRTGVPIVPCSIVGAEEIYPMVGNLPALARLLGVPYIPITPLFPLLGPLGLIPLPSKWIIEFGEPIRTDAYDAGAADDPMLVFNVTDQVRETIQQTLYSLLMRRKSVFH